MVEAPKEIMDRFLCYRNLLAAEDHLRELRLTATTSDKQNEADNYLVAIQGIRDNIGFVEVNPHYHCLFKHLAAAYEAACEVVKVTHDKDDAERASLLEAYCRWALEQLTGTDIVICGRCGVQYGDDTGQNQ